jgi:ectoine hydroxylase-related dioxygenase (phytanoyl-CoA dioxygenase family)
MKRVPVFQAKALEKEKILEAMKTDGCFVVEGVLDTEYIARTIPALEDAIAKEASWHGTTDYVDYGMVLICSLYGLPFWQLFDNAALMQPFETVLGEGCIVYAYTSSSMPPNSQNYSARIHVDCPRLIPGYVTNMGATILLSEFTKDNGATYFLPGSHERLQAPSDAEFKEKSLRLVAKPGSVFFFNARIWHSGGKNTTDRWRHALTINMCRPFMRQRIDLPRAMAQLDLTGMSNKAKQKLGFDVQVPTSMEEYYAPPEKRKFKQKAE